MPEFIDTGTQDFMSRSTRLRQHGAARTIFDPTNFEHRESLRVFNETGNWGAVQFHIEFPYTDVPMTVLRKFSKYALEQLGHGDGARNGAPSDLFLRRAPITAETAELFNEARAKFLDSPHPNFAELQLGSGQLA